MAIITVSRELAALGDETAHELERLLDCRLVDKETLEERIKSYGMTGPKLAKYDERKPSFLASLSQDRDDYLHFLKTAVLTEAAMGNCVLVGRGAALILKNVPGVVSIFLAAPLEIRLERVKSYFHCDDRRARQVIAQSDRDRGGFHHYFFDVKWRDPANYHLTTNTGRAGPVVVAELTRVLRDQIAGPEAEAAGAIRLGELSLGQRVKHHILYEKGIPVHFLEAQAAGKKITLYGVANAASLAEAALAAAREAAEDWTVSSEIQVVQEYRVMP